MFTDAGADQNDDGQLRTNELGERLQFGEGSAAPS